MNSLTPHQPAVSVITPVYNAAPFLRRTLDSVLSQTLSSIEHILIDDGSTDGSGQILDEYRDAHPDRRISVIHQPNSGVPAYNPGLERARGEYVAFLDHDDCLAENFCELLYNKAVAEDADICKGECIAFTADGKRNHPTQENATIRQLRSKLGFVHFIWTAIYRRQMLQEHNIRFDEQLILGQDTLFQNEAVLACGNLALCDDAHYYFQCERGDSITDKSGGYDSQKIGSVLDAYRRIVTNLNRRRQQCGPKGMAYVIFRLIIVLIDGIARNVRDPDDARRCEACARRMLRQCPVTAQSLVRKNLKNNVPQIATQLGIR